jgi:AmmeMemoRadiSam system protein A
MQSRRLSDDQRRVLADLARRSVEARVLGFSLPPALPAVDFPPVSGVFVTVKLGGNLRGCLGTLECPQGVSTDVIRCAADAASEDPRFAPIAPDELPDVTLEVSVLGPLERIDPREPQAFVVGEHGLVVERGRHRGLLLPQVATEWNWTAEEFLRHASHKAGLPWDGWQQGATVYRFSAEVFGR